MADELYLISGSTLTDIGDAIRGAKGTTAKIQVGNYASEIRNSIPTYYTVTFKGLNNETLATYQVKHGDGVVYTGITPTDSSGYYFFEQWDTDTTTITKDTVVKPIKVDKWAVADGLSHEQGNHVSGYCQIIGSQRQEYAIVPAKLYDGTNVDDVMTGVFGTSLRSIVIGTYVKPAARAFSNCTNLQDVYFLGTKSFWFSTLRNVVYTGSSSSDQEYNQTFWLAPRIHTTDGCIMNT